MITAEEKEFFLEQGYLVVEGAVRGEHLARLQREFDEVWEKEKAPPCTQHELLQYRTFIELIEHPPILDRQRAIFGNQVQLLQYDFLRQGPHSQVPAYRWHRDFTFPGDRPLSINTILFIDDIRMETGATSGTSPWRVRWRCPSRPAAPSSSTGPSGTPVGATARTACGGASTCTTA